jgi:hypothetical protein
MAGKLERIMLEFKSFIHDEELKKKFDEVYQQVAEANKNNLIAHIPVGHMDEEILDISYFKWVDDYEIKSGTRYDNDGNEFKSEAEYKVHIRKLADEEFAKWSVREEKDGNNETIYVVYNADGERYAWNYSEGESLQEIDEKKEAWIEDKFLDFDDLEMQYHEIHWNTVWCFNSEVNREVADKVGLGYLEMNKYGDEYIFLLGCGMDLTPQIIAYQALAHGYIQEKYLRYFEDDMLKYTKGVMGDKVFNEVIEKLGVTRFFENRKGDAE